MCHDQWCDWQSDNIRRYHLRLQRELILGQVLKLCWSIRVLHYPAVGTQILQRRAEHPQLMDRASRRGVTVNTGFTAIIERFWIQKGNSSSDYGGGIKNSGTLTLNNSVLSNNVSSGSGGGIENFPHTSILTINNSTINGNSGSGGGGILTWDHRNY